MKGIHRKTQLYLESLKSLNDGIVAYNEMLLQIKYPKEIKLLSNKLVAALNDRRVLVDEIISVIHQVPEDTLKRLLVSKYLQYHTWEQIAEELNVSVAWACNHMKFDAFDSVRNILDIKEDV